MRSRSRHGAARAPGFAVPLMLIVSVLVAALAAAALSEARLGTRLVTTQQLRQRAVYAADHGIDAAVAALAHAGTPATVPGEARLDDMATARIELSPPVFTSLPPGYSANRFRMRHDRVGSRGSSARHTGFSVVQGLDTLEPLELAGIADACATDGPLALTVRWPARRGATPRTLHLAGGSTPGLQLVDPATGQVLWSARPSGPADQRFADMHAPFGASMTAIDTDSDGTADRIYAGDRAARVWRFDLQPGAAANAWITGGIIAELHSAPGVRQIIAAPDVALHRSTNKPAWLSIAVGTTSAQFGTSGNRLFVLRDEQPFRSLQQADYALLSRAPSGYSIDLGADQALSQTLTVNGRIIFATATTRPGSGSCSARHRAGAVMAEDGKPALDLNADGQTDARDLRTSLPESRALRLLQLAVAPAAPHPRVLQCRFDAFLLPGCEIDTRPRRRYWLPEGVD